MRSAEAAAFIGLLRVTGAQAAGFDDFSFHDDHHVTAHLSVGGAAEQRSEDGDVHEERHAAGAHIHRVLKQACDHERLTVLSGDEGVDVPRGELETVSHFTLEAADAGVDVETYFAVFGYERRDLKYGSVLDGDEFSVRLVAAGHDEVDLTPTGELAWLTAGDGHAGVLHASPQVLLLEHVEGGVNVEAGESLAGWPQEEL